MKPLWQLFGSGIVMNSSETSDSCYEDWQRRRKSHLTSASASAPWTKSQVKIFDYLIRRYRDSAEAHKPARFSLRTNLDSHDRRITVHRHLGCGQVAGVKSEFEAESRVTRIVRRMASGGRSHDTLFSPSNVQDYPSIPMDHWRSIGKGIKQSRNVDQDIRRALTKCPLLPTDAVRHLVSRVANASTFDTVAVELLLQCENKAVLECSLRAWRERVAKGQSADEVSKTLVSRFRQSAFREHAAEFMRELLADDARVVRIAATRLIAEFGNLDDIGLLSELLAIPDSDDDERCVLVGAMKTIAEK